MTVDFAAIDLTQSPNVVVAVFTSDADYAGEETATRMFVDVTTLSPQPAATWTYDPTTQAFTEPVTLANQATLLSKAQAALTNNETFLALATPTSAQAVAQVQALTRQVNALIRLATSELSSVSGT